MNMSDSYQEQSRIDFHSHYLPPAFMEAVHVAAGQGTGSSSGLDPSIGLGSQGAKDEDDIAMGSTMPGVALGRHLDADWTTVLKGIHTDIDLDSDVVVKIQLK